MRGAARALAACALAACFAASAQPPPCEGDAAGTLSAKSEHYTLRLRFEPPPAVARHFSLLFTVCGRGAPAAPEAVSVDARMPAHGHGMNYRASISPLGDGRYRADGLMFHMPGRWELLFVVRGDGRSERIVHPVELQ